MTEKNNAVFHARAELEKVIQPWLKHPDWEGIIRLSDYLRANEEEVSHELSHRIYLTLKTEKNEKVVWLTLIVLDTLVKHGPDSFLTAVAQVEFMQLLHKILKKRWVKRKKVTLEMNYKNLIGEWVVHMIRDWGTMYPHVWSSSYPMFNRMYQMCLQEGVQFPLPSQRPKDMTPPPEKSPAKKAERRRADQNRQQNAAKVSLSTVENDIKACAAATSLLNEIISNTPAKDIATNEIALDVVIEINELSKKLGQYTGEDLPSETLGTLLGTHDRAQSVLESFARAQSSGVYHSPSTSEEEIILKPQRRPSSRSPGRKKSKGKSENSQHQGPFLATNPPFTNTVAAQGTAAFSISQGGDANPFLTNPNPFNSNGQPNPFMASNPFNSNPSPNPFASNANPNPFATSPNPHPFVAQPTNPSPFSPGGGPQPSLVVHPPHPYPQPQSYVQPTTASYPQSQPYPQAPQATYPATANNNVAYPPPSTGMHPSIGTYPGGAPVAYSQPVHNPNTAAPAAQQGLQNPFAMQF